MNCPMVREAGVATWMVRGNQERRKSRLHTLRGEPLPSSCWGDVPLALLERASRRQWNRPWMIRRAVQRLDEVLQPDMTVLELGSGLSTRWYAHRARLVESVEPNRDWATTVQQQVDRDGLTDKVVL